MHFCSSSVLFLQYFQLLLAFQGRLIEFLVKFGFNISIQFTLFVRDNFTVKFKDLNLPQTCIKHKIIAITYTCQVMGTASGEY
jgi:hypothetical protein